MNANDILTANNQPISGDDIVGIQNSLLEAAQSQRDAADRQARQANQLAQQQINVANNASGTLFSSRPIFQGAQQAAGTYIPQVTQNAATWGETTIDTKNTVADALREIQAYNKAAQELLAGRYASV